MNKSMRVVLSRLQRYLTCPGSTTTVPKRVNSLRFTPKVHELEDRAVPSGSDMFADATALSGLFATDTGSLVGATAELNEPAPVDTAGTLNTIWWKWTAPQGGLVEANTLGSALDDTVLAVYTGNAVDNLTQLDANDDYYDFQSRVLFSATAGTTYYFQIDGFDNLTGDIVFNVGAAPANDNFASATPFVGTTMTGWNLAATYETGEPAPVPNSDPVNSVWWKWTAAGDGQVEVNTAGSALDTNLAVFSGTSFSDLSFVDLNDNYYGLQSRVVFNAEAGKTYYFDVDGFNEFTGAITINLLGAPTPTNHAPLIAAQALNVNENSPANTIVGTVIASDPDSGQSLSYSFDSNPSGAFAINAGTGQITVVNPSLLDYETTHSFLTQVRVTDNGSPAMSATAFVTINLTDVNEPPQFVQHGPYGVDEMTAAGTPVGLALAVDLDAGQTVSYAITGGNTGAAFAIDPHTGLISVANPSALDFETHPVFTLNVQATDSASPALSATTLVLINLGDVNDSPVIAAQGFTVGAGAAAGTIVGTVQASDQDVGQHLSYSIISGNDAGAFSIDAATGQITVASAAGLGSASSFVLSVKVTDDGVPSISVTGLVTISVASANHAPVLDNTGNMSLTGINAGNTANSGTSVVAILASAGGTRITDADAGALTGIAVTAADTAHGLWQYSTNGGSTWNSLGAVSNTSARLLAADVNTRVRFLPNAGYSGTVNPALTFRAWDRTTGANGGTGDTSLNGGATAFSTALETASIAVYSVQQQINNLSASIQSLYTNHTLSSGDANALQANLNNALAKANQGNSGATINNLKAFIGKVQSFVAAGTLSASVGQSLIDVANAAIQTLSVA